MYRSFSPTFLPVGYTNFQSVTARKVFIIIIIIELPFLKETLISLLSLVMSFLKMIEKN